MKKGLVQIVISLSLLLSSLMYLLYPYQALALFGLGPFGGMILVSIPCDDGSFLETLSLPTPGLYMYSAGRTLSYLAAPPIHPGQWVLGVSGPPYVCIEGPIIIGTGFLMLFEGASI